MSTHNKRWFVVEETPYSDDFGNGPTHIAITSNDDDTVDAIAWMQEGTLADAHLMAAAPQLLHGCKMAVDALRMTGKYPHTIRVLERIISQAEKGSCDGKQTESDTQQ